MLCQICWDQVIIPGLTECCHNANVCAQCSADLQKYNEVCPDCCQYQRQKQLDDKYPLVLYLNLAQLRLDTHFNLLTVGLSLDHNHLLPPEYRINYQKILHGHKKNIQLELDRTLFDIEVLRRLRLSPNPNKNTLLHIVQKCEHINRWCINLTINKPFKMTYQYSEVYFDTWYEPQWQEVKVGLNTLSNKLNFSHTNLKIDHINDSKFAIWVRNKWDSAEAICFYFSLGNFAFDGKTEQRYYLDEHGCIYVAKGDKIYQVKLFNPIAN